MSIKTSGDINEYIQALKASKVLGSQVVFHQVVPPCAAAYGAPRRAWSPEVSRILVAAGVEALYQHQVAAIDLIRDRQHVVAATPTASGKTLMYNLPVLEQVLADTTSRALYLFPLKALAQDQLRSFQELTEAHNASPGTAVPVEAAIYDGDTTAWQRRKIRATPPHVLLTNPEMLHLSLLAHHARWADFLRALTFVVVDEVHIYRGLLGAHIAQVFQRLRRICTHYGSQPQFIFCSATVDNPAGLTQQLCGLPVAAVTDSGAPCGKRHLLFINPFDSAARTAILLLKAALHRGLRTIVYCQSRKLTELIALWAAEKSGALRTRISAYRAGFLPAERRQIEARLSRGELLAVITTSALELGIDIGDLDLCILVGYPGTIVAMRQRSGRVGRSGQDAAMIMIAGEDALDQYVMRNPQAFTRLPPEAAVVNPHNVEIVTRHLLCAAQELPLRPDEAWLQVHQTARVVKKMLERGDLLMDAHQTALYPGRRLAHNAVDLRGSGARYMIFCRQSGNLLGEIDGARAFRETHPGAVYLHNRRTWLVDDLDIEARTVSVRPVRPPYYTRVRSHKDTEILEQLDRQRFGDLEVGLGRLRVTEHVRGYEKLQLQGGRKLSVHPLALPPLVFETEGLWIGIPATLQQDTDRQQLHFMGGIHALEHAAIGIFPLLVMTDRNDLGGLATPLHAQLGGAAVFIYDAVAGGAGLTRQAFARIDSLLHFTSDMIDHCHCENGCPACVQSPRCGAGNRPLDKAAARYILQQLVQRLQTGKRTEPSEARETAAGFVPAPATPPPTAARAARPDAHYGVLDLETQLSAAEVGGWHNSASMRVSCAVLYDSREDCLLDFTEDRLPALLAHLQRLELVVGFNLKRFDYRVLSAYTATDLAALPTLDMLEEVHRRLGYRLSLDHLASETLGVAKSADGLQALTWWKQGRIDRIIEYCRQDVAITRDLYLYGRKHGYVLFHNKAGATVRLPVDW